MNGELEQTNEGWRLRFTRRLDHSPEKVWRAITEPEHLKSWFPTRPVGDLTAVGSRVSWEFDDHDLPAMQGEVLACEPPSLIEFGWGPDRIRMEISPEGDGCVLVLTDLLDELGKAARDGAGWHTCLDRLEDDLAGRDAGDTSGRWREVHPGYVEKFGPEASTLGPPEGVNV